MRVLVVVAIAGCWTNDPRPTTAPVPVVHYDFHAVDAGVDDGWRATVIGDRFTIVHAGKTHYGTLAHGPRALDFRGADGSVLLACRRTAVAVHPLGADLTVACAGDSTEGTPAWSEPALSVDAWSCLVQDLHVILGPQEVIFVEEVPIERVVRECCQADVCRGYDGYRRRR
jgi:hypothetical protein